MKQNPADVCSTKAPAQSSLVFTWTWRPLPAFQAFCPQFRVPRKLICVPSEGVELIWRALYRILRVSLRFCTEVKMTSPLHRARQLPGSAVHCLTQMSTEPSVGQEWSPCSWDEHRTAFINVCYLKKESPQINWILESQMFSGKLQKQQS
jgi:hypothetical protein